MTSLMQKITTHCDATGNAPKKANKSGPSKGKVIASVTMEDTDEQTSSEDGDFVMAVMPSAVLGSGSFSEDNISPLLHSKHFMVKFNIVAKHLDFPLTFTALINNGAHLVLICPKVVDAL